MNVVRNSINIEGLSNSCSVVVQRVNEFFCVWKNQMSCYIL